MGMDMVIAYVAVPALFLFAISFLRVRRPQLQVPPSPAAIPFLGHLHLLQKPLHAAFARLAERHGPVFSLRLGSRDVVVVSSAACARQCFTEHDLVFANRPRFPTMLVASFGCTTLPTCSYGPYWRMLRRLATVQLLSSHRVAGMSADISNEVRAMVRRMGRAAAAAPGPGGAALVELKRTLFEVSLSALMERIARTKTSRTEEDADTDMSPEAQPRSSRSPWTRSCHWSARPMCGTSCRYYSGSTFSA
jgi:hypothetical protein